MDGIHPIPFYDFYDVEQPVSATDMTGLIPAAVEDDDEADAYESLYPNHRQTPICQSDRLTH